MPTTPEQPVYEYRVEAYNTATESTNRMHDDAVARTFGFRGGLVPGVDVWAYMTRPCIDRWGKEFLTGGTMTVRLRAPVYDGEVVTATLDGEGALALVGPDGGVRAGGSASMGEVAPVKSIPTTESSVPESAPPVTAELLASGTVLHPLRFTYRKNQAELYLGSIRETSPIYESGAVGHPGFLARQANYVLSRNVRLGPWIHVSTTAHHRGIVRDGDEIEVRGAVCDEREHKGHRFVDLDVEITANELPVWSAFHTAIWRPRQ